MHGSRRAELLNRWRKIIARTMISSTSTIGIGAEASLTHRSELHLKLEREVGASMTLPDGSTRDENSSRFDVSLAECFMTR